uniref:uncharacterized protein LOC101304368 isoform X2 n=1 Tax=Fragaria vesca subsp. vesca TaxID=101020 RepID=UPI0005C8E333|nr:PREDICTED: uncharacterized protein LOC101304368 isoform X2 [Fragaria vesca subsp. vesca]
MEDVKRLRAETYGIDPAVAESVIPGLEFESCNLRQGDMTVLEYGRLFNRSYRFVSPLVANERDKIHKFQQGLRDELRDMLVVTLFTEFSQVFLAAMKYEDRLLECVQPLEVGFPSQGPSEKASTSSSSAALTCIRPENSRPGSLKRRRERRRSILKRHKKKTNQSGGSVASSAALTCIRPENSRPGSLKRGRERRWSILNRRKKKTNQSGGSVGGNSRAPVQGDRPQCQRCSRYHDGQCQVGLQMIGSSVCYQCGCHGHYLRQCPQLT